MRINKNKLVCKLFKMKEVTLGDVFFHLMLFVMSALTVITIAESYKIFEFIVFSYPFEVVILLSSLVTGMCVLFWVVEGLFNYKIAECPLK